MTAVVTEVTIVAFVTMVTSVTGCYGYVNVPVVFHLVSSADYDCHALHLAYVRNARYCIVIS